MRRALDEEVVAHALDVALAELKKRMAAAEPRRLEAEIEALDTKIGRALDLAIELGDMDTAKERLRDLRAEREKVARQLSQVRTELPTAEQLMPRLREKLREIEATLKSDIALGRLALGGLLSDRRLRVYRDGRIEGALSLGPETALPAPRRAQEPADSVVAGEGFEPPTSGL